MTGSTGGALDMDGAPLHPDETHFAGIGQIGFQRLIESNADGVLVVDLAGAVLYANPAAARIFGQPLHKLLHISLGRPVAPGDIAEITVRRPNGTSAEVEMRVVEIAWDGHVALLASLRDVSAQRALEERRRQSQKVEAVGRLAAGIVHDINNLLTVFQSGLSLLQKKIAQDPSDPKIALMFDELRSRTQNGSALTQQLLAFSRRQSLSPEVIDVNARIASLSSLLDRTLGRGVKVLTVFDPALGPALIDPNQFDVAILNLAVNARDAMSDGGSLTIETSNATDDFEEMSDAAGTFIRVSVRDTGCGMSKDVMANVFEPFFTTKGDGEGTGLGLSQVYGFVSQSGGHVRLDSEVGKGTTVHLFLPRAPSRA
ncbi:two-component system sensor histidine kinase NtrB [Rhizorhabdus histidinilytica]|uniref:two-component system sensor histidine kinase NtrB n=1 Tax=Rhizorhabdus histidinilytica TaxID=439228 RepID=UPI00321FEF1F